MRYAIGVMAGVLSGLVFAASSIAQKRAMNVIGVNVPMFRNLLKSPLWLAGFIASFAIGAPLNMAAGIAQAITNALMAPIAGQFGHLFTGRLDTVGLMIAGGTSLALVGVNGGALVLAQLALRRGAAAEVVPLQYVPVQIIPLIFHVFMYQSVFESSRAIACVALGVPLLLIGAFAVAPAGSTAMRLREGLSTGPRASKARQDAIGGAS